MSGPQRTGRHVLPARARAWLRIGGTALVLALVVLGVGIAVNLTLPVKHLSETTGATVNPGEADYLAGLDALASGDQTKAVELLGTAAVAGNTAAEAKLAELSSVPTSAPSVVASEAYLSAVSDVSSLLPAAIKGYTMSAPERSGASAIVSAEPVLSSQRAIMSRVALTVFDKKSVSGAAEWLAGFSVAYPEDNSDVHVGDVTARFGTDGAHLAAVSFTRGRFAFELVATSVQGEPVDLKTLAVTAASAFAAAHNAE